ncbi:ribbon-helix-helix domain-containing protein [Nakamurella lactea]|uniref:ribbon-helix-helix domain-containing protein n=1 Tax=Nakamurella lactea TaxID=459515 RepID=UPI000414E133|nr:CopG family transcriptional regulator [Nakamurella lactea]
MKKTTIYLDDTDDLRLQQAAVRRGSSRTDLIRTAIRRLLDSEEAPSDRPRVLGRSGHRDTSEHVDDLLAEGFGQ